MLLQVLFFSCPPPRLLLYPPLPPFCALLLHARICAIALAIVLVYLVELLRSSVKSASPP